MEAKIKLDDKMLEEYQAEMKRHQKAIEEIKKKYMPFYDVEFDNR